MLLKLFAQTTGSGNPSYLTNLLPGGAGVQVAGTTVNPYISGPRLEEVQRNVYDCSASISVPTPQASGKLLILTPQLGGGATIGIPGASVWNQSTRAGQPIPQGAYGVVFTPARSQEETAASGGATGSQATVVTNGPVNALLTTGPTTTTAISAGMLLAADGAGNLTYAGATPAAGTVLAMAMGSLATGISTPTLGPVFIGGY